MEILIWSLVAYGMSNILVWGSIFSTARQAIHDMANIPGLHQPIANFFSGLIQCMMCTSTWVGFFLSLVYYSPSQEWMNFTPFFSWFFDGMLASGVVWSINALIEYWEGNRSSN
jgi:hypothetical protein